ncbi:transposase [Bathymodiolus platifrons methanotrophic gill symbiont]|uniref:transposase n=1 Tax=Bathymodiolus platifrons methanotrophic gill symbiont TaxID=113268 RepID=UPI001C8D83AE|nr:transposase [Bathymodiolus platifrons methanotrophic gill symbiont]
MPNNRFNPLPDFDLVNHGNERQCALAHLKTLTTGDVVVYDRGYFSYAMLYYHMQMGVHPVFRLQKNTFKAQARHATSRNSGTPVAVIRSPTQRIGDAPAALRPPQTEHKAAQSWLPQMALRLFGIKF